MKTWKLLLAVALAVAAVFALTSLVAAAPASTSGAQINRMNDNPDRIVTDTLPMTHPVGSMIATFFNISYTEVMSLHVEGYGFGVIARAYFVTQALSKTLTLENVMAVLQAGRGWGQIKKMFDVQPGGKNLGVIMGQGNAKQKSGPPSQPPSQPQPQPGGPAMKQNKGAPSCPGNSCNAPGQQKSFNGKPTKTPKN